jgi:hypothetical protein
MSNIIDMKKTVTVSLEEYEDLRADAALLAGLHACGVDDWEGYGEALEIADELTGESDA